MKPIVIFGIGELAEVAYFYFTHDSNYKVIAFTVDSQFISNSQFCNLPVVSFEEVETIYPPESFNMFVAIGYTKINLMRMKKCEEAKLKGYQLASYVSSKATVWSNLGIGENRFILEDNTIQPFVEIGNNVILWSGNHIGHHSKIADNCFITSHVVISGGVRVGKNCFIGVNSTIRDHITIADNCVIAAGSLILADTQKDGVYMSKGNKAELSKVPSYRLKNL